MTQFVTIRPAWFRYGVRAENGLTALCIGGIEAGWPLPELGTGTGVGSAWLLAGMDSTARLDTVDNDAAVLAIAQRHLGHNPRVTFHLMEGMSFLQRSDPMQFDFVYADTWPGKFTHLDSALSLLRIGGIYFVDDLLPQPSWPERHAPKVPALIAELESRPGFTATKRAWASGLMILVRTAL